MSATVWDGAAPKVGPVWLLLGELNDGQLSVTVTNAGDEPGRELDVRMAWHRGLGPVVASLPVLHPDETLHLTASVAAAQLDQCQLMVEWRDGGVRHRMATPVSQFSHQECTQTCALSA